MTALFCATGCSQVGIESSAAVVAGEGNFLRNGDFSAPLDVGWRSAEGFAREDGRAVGDLGSALVARIEIPDYARHNPARILVSLSPDEGAELLVSMAGCSVETCTATPTRWRIHHSQGKAVQYVLSVTGELPATSELRLQTDAGRAIIDEVAFLVEGTVGVQGLCEPTPLSHVGEAVSKTLESYALTREGSSIISQLSRCNTIPERFTFVEQKEFDDRLLELIAATESRARISTYSVEEEGIRKIARGLLALQNAVAHDREPYPLIEFLYSQAPLVTPSPDELLEIIEEEMGVPQEQWRFFLVLRQYSVFGSLDYNHSKIAVRDGIEALQGGHNLIRFIDEPVDDLTMVLSGEAARAAEEHFDAMWRRAQEKSQPRLGPEELGYDCGGSKNFGPGYACARDEENGYFRDIVDSGRVRALPPVLSPPSSTSVFGLGRGRFEVDPEVGSQPDFSADHAIIAAFGAARASIKLVQHTLTNHVLPLENHLNPEVEAVLLEALLGRDVHVDMIISDAWPKVVNKSADAVRAVKLLYEAAPEYARKHYPQRFPDDESVFAHLDCHLRSYRYRRPGNDQPLTHAKFFIIDDISYYVGAQNLYPNVDILDHLDEESGRQLVNFGYLVDSAEATERVIEAFFEPIARESQAERVWPPSRAPADDACSP